MFSNSKLLATLVAAGAAVVSAGAAAADVKGSAYADLRYGLDYFNDNSAGPDDTQFENHGSFWGFKGSVEQNGITAFGGYERWLDADDTFIVDVVRQAYAGVTGGFGTVQYGTFATAYMDAGRKLDPFFGTGAAGVGKPTGTIWGGQSHGLSPLTNDASAIIVGTGGFVANQLAYTTPTLWGATINTAVFFDEAAGENEQEDYAVGAEFSQWGATAGVQHLQVNNGGNIGLGEDEEATRVYAGFAQQRFGVSISGERLNLIGAPDADYVNLSGWYGVLEGTRIAASYGYENETGTDGDSFRVGVFHDIVDNFTTHVVYRNYNATDFVAPDDEVISLGASFRFELNGTTSTR